MPLMIPLLRSVPKRSTYVRSIKVGKIFGAGGYFLPGVRSQYLVSESFKSVIDGSNFKKKYE